MVITLVPGGILGDAFGFGAPQGDVLARVGDEQVTVAEVTQTANNMGRQQFPRGFPSQFRPFLMQRAADQLILQKAMISEAHRMSIAIVKDQIRARGEKVTDYSVREINERADEIAMGPWMILKAKARVEALMP